MGSKDQGGCFAVIGILMMVAGFLWWFPLFIMGALFLFCGICSSSKSKKRRAQQATPTFTQQAAQQQPAPQPVQQPVVAPVPEKPPDIPRYCPDCGAPIKGEKFCPLCGAKI